jgi:hypothetical protein
MDPSGDDVRQLRLAEQAILKQSLDDKNERIEELEREVKYLRNVLNSALAVPKAQPAPGPAGSPKKSGPIPRRWNV